MKTFIIYFSILFVFILGTGCSKETTPTLVYPTSFVFNTPSLEDRSVYRIDSVYVLNPATSVRELQWRFRKLADTLGSYDKSNGDIADTINFIIREEFSKSMISKITLLSSSSMEVEYSCLIKDTISPLNDKLVFKEKRTLDYQQVGNILSQGLYINNDFREIYICNEFILATQKLPDTTTFQKYFRNTCNGPDAIRSLDRFVNDHKEVKYDTASVEYVNYIFSSFK